MNLSHTYFRFSDVDKRWQDNSILRQLDLEIAGGECLLITGQNGSGKTTLLRILSGLLKPCHAKINTANQRSSWHQARKTLYQQVMYLHQTPYLFDCSVEKNLRYVKSPLHFRDAMQWADISHLALHNGRQLSGGEAQRVALARAWLKRPKVLLLDEPTANLDTGSRRRMVEMLGFFKAQGMGIVIASHDPVHFRQVVDRHNHLCNGTLAQVGAKVADNLIRLKPRDFGACDTGQMASVI